MVPPWSVPIFALTPAACGATRWRKAGTTWVTILVKATFDLVPGQLAKLAAPREIVREDSYRERSGSLTAASETAPYLPGAGVLLAGHAHAPGGRSAPTAAARLAVVRERPLLDKTVHVFGDRAPGANHPQPFQKIPLVYERAYGGAGMPENPVGVGAPGTTAQPNILGATSPQRPAGFGPISRYWPARKRLLGSGDERGLQSSDPLIPEGFDWRYFHAAPPDQQIERIHGDEWIVLDGMHPSLPRVQSRLPSAVGKARWQMMTASGSGPEQAIELAADTLVIDADQLICSVVWRGRFALERPELAPWTRVLAGVEIGGQPISWSRAQDTSTAPLGSAPQVASSTFSASSAPAPSEARALARTSDLDLQAVLATILPFAAIDTGRPAPVAMKSEAPAIPRAPAALSGTSDLDLSHVLSAIVPFQPARPRSPLASTGGLGGLPLGPALPFALPDPSKPVGAVALLSAAPLPPARKASALGSTADIDMQQAIRAAVPFKGLSPSGPGAVEPARVPVPVVLPAPELVAAHEPVPTPEPEPIPAPAPAAPSAPLLLTDAVIKAPPASEPASLREQIVARLNAGGTLQGLPLGGADLQDFDFAGATLAGLDLRRANLQRANLAGARAAEIQLEGADLTEASFERADLARANLTRAVVTRARFDGATLTGANLQRTSGDEPSFRTARLDSADLRQARLGGAIFDEASLSKAMITRADLRGSRFVRADLSSANLRESKLREADFTRANLEDADLRDADLQGARLDGEARTKAKLTPGQVRSLGERKA